MKEVYELIREGVITTLASHGVEVSTALLDVIFFAIAAVFTYVLVPLAGLLKTWIFLRKTTVHNNPFYSPAEINKALINFVPTKFQNIPPSIEQEPSNTHAITAQQKLIPFFLNVFRSPEYSNKYYIILADSGMGKTTFLINLLSVYQRKLFNRYNIFLFPLSQPNIEEDIKAISDEKKCKSIILLDALDEDRNAVDNYVQRIDDLMTLTVKFRFVLLTCRTQFFPFEEAEPSEIGIKKHGTDGEYHIFKKIYISPFNDANIRTYLFKKYMWRIPKILKAFRIVKSSPYLMVRPMLLNYIDDLIDSKRSLNNIFEIYDYLVTAWIRREVNRKKPSERKHFGQELRMFSEKIAFQIYKNFETNSMLSISGHQIGLFAKEHGINISDLELKSKSLLNRDANGNYKFAHKSILEYFLAIKAFHQFDFLKDFNFKSFTYTKRLYNGLCLKRIFDSDLFQSYDIKREQLNKPSKVTIKSTDAHIIQSLAGLPKVTSLTIKNLKLSNDYLHYLKMIDDVIHLDLSENNISDTSMLNNLETLNSLNLNNNSIARISLDSFKNLESCDLSSNSIESISIDLQKLNVLDLSNNPLTRLNIDCKKLKILNIRNTKLHHIPKLDKSVQVLKNQDFEKFLIKSENLIKKGNFGVFNLMKEDDGIFNVVKVTDSFCEYIYDVNLNRNASDSFDFSAGLNVAKIELIRELLHSASKSTMDISPTEYDQTDFINFMDRDGELTIKNSFFKRIVFKRKGEKLMMKLSS